MPWPCNLNTRSCWRTHATMTQPRPVLYLYECRIVLLASTHIIRSRKRQSRIKNQRIESHRRVKEGRRKEIFSRSCVLRQLYLCHSRRLTRPVELPLVVQALFAVGPLSSPSVPVDNFLIRLQVHAYLSVWLKLDLLLGDSIYVWRGWKKRRSNI